MTTDAPSRARARAMAKPIPAVDPVTSAFFPFNCKFIGAILFFISFRSRSFPAQVIDGEAVVGRANQQQIINGRVNHLYSECVPVAAQSCAEHECNYQQSAAHQGASITLVSVVSPRRSPQMEERTQRGG